MSSLRREIFASLLGLINLPSEKYRSIAEHDLTFHVVFVSRILYHRAMRFTIKSRFTKLIAPFLANNSTVSIAR